MRQTTFLIIGLFILVFDSKAQDKACFEVKYLDFFGLEAFDTLKWPDSELDKLLEADLTLDGKTTGSKTNFLIPIIVLQLKGLHPNCEYYLDTNRYQKLIQLYFKIRQQDINLLNRKTVVEQLETIRQDYYDQVLNDTLLSFMHFTLDDGPLFGQVSEIVPGLESGESITIEFGKLTIVKSNKKVFLIATDGKEQVIWSRVMTGLSDRVLTDLNFHKDPVSKTSRAYIISMYSEGERLTLYLNLDGSFMNYFHSW